MAWSPSHSYSSSMVSSVIVADRHIDRKSAWRYHRYRWDVIVWVLRSSVVASHFVSLHRLYSPSLERSRRNLSYIVPLSVLFRLWSRLPHFYHHEKDRERWSPSDSFRFVLAYALWASVDVSGLKEDFLLLCRPMSMAPNMMRKARRQSHGIVRKPKYWT